LLSKFIAAPCLRNSGDSKLEKTGGKDHDSENIFTNPPKRDGQSRKIVK
jgi:hypothetical protein